jgi:transketolase
LGQGLSVGVGMALTGKMDNKKWNVYTILGDGELQEGSVWEAAMSASHYKLNNLIAIIDRNYCQIDGNTEKVMQLEPLSEKWNSFGWRVFECDGNNHESFLNAVSIAKAEKKRPCVIIAKTKMGKGVKSIEGDYRWHGKVPNEEQLKLFLDELYI